MTVFPRSVCGALARKLRDIPAERVISPALGGIIVGHEVARTLGKVSGGQLGHERVITTNRFAQLCNHLVVENRGFAAHCVTPDGARPSAAANSATRMGLLT